MTREKIMAIIERSILMGYDLVVMSTTADGATHELEVFLKIIPTTMVKEIDKEKLCVTLTNGSKVYFVYEKENQLLGGRLNTVHIDQDVFKIKIQESEE